MVNLISWLNEAFEYDKAHPHYVEGIKQGSLKVQFFICLGLLTILIAILFFGK